MRVERVKKNLERFESKDKKSYICIIPINKEYTFFDTLMNIYFWRKSKYKNKTYKEYVEKEKYNRTFTSAQSVGRAKTNIIGRLKDDMKNNENEYRRVFDNLGYRDEYTEYSSIPWKADKNPIWKWVEDGIREVNKESTENKNNTEIKFKSEKDMRKYLEKEIEISKNTDDLEKMYDLLTEYFSLFGEIYE